jgi:hypothetical protein
MGRALFAVTAALGVFTSAALGPLRATELSIPSPGTAAPANCGPCGCLAVGFVYHRQLEATYGLSYDPRNYDTTEPRYYFGPIRRYPRYYVDGVPVRGPC